MTTHNEFLTLKAQLAIKLTSTEVGNKDDQHKGAVHYVDELISQCIDLVRKWPMPGLYFVF